MNTDLLSHFSWGEFALATFFYTLLPFLSGARYGDLAGVLKLLAKVKSAPRPIIGIHVGFLILLLGILWESARICSSIPPWMTEQNSKRLSVLDLAVGILVLLMATVEERWILNLKSSNRVAPGV